VVSGLAVSGAGLGILIPTLNLCLIAETPVLYRGRVLGGIAYISFLRTVLLSYSQSAAYFSIGKQQHFHIDWFCADDIIIGLCWDEDEREI